MRKPLIVAVGASAGGLEALTTMFRAAPAQTGMSFIVVQHLSPDYKSMMAELLARQTALRVEGAQDGITPQVDTIYVIEPQTLIRLDDEVLRIEHHDRGDRAPQPINIFFESVAGSRHGDCVGVILSGTGSDGALGVAALKEHGATVVVQDPETASFDGMPNAALRTGMVDMVLPPSLMISELMELTEDGPATYFGLGGEHGKQVLSRIIRGLRNHTGVDFSRYKPSTIVRRTERRMADLRIDDTRLYADRVREDPAEATALFRDLLIGVTSFLRDPGAIKQLATTAIPKLVERPGSLRLWVAGCSTGEEAYTIAMLLTDALVEANRTPDFRLFATDIDGEALDAASAGEFPASIAEKISPESLNKHFHRSGEHFIARSALRDRILFSRHNVIENPPFSRLDFISCRNLLIYFKQSVQERVLRTFANALKSDGILWLGSSETLGKLEDEFSALSSRWRIYQGRPGRQRKLLTPLAGSPLAFRNISTARAENRQERLTRALERSVLGYAPPTLIIDERFRLIYRYGDLSELLRVPMGIGSNDVREMLPRELATIVGTSFLRAKNSREDLLYRSLRATRGEASKSFDLRARLLPGQTEDEGDLLALMFERLTQTSVDVVDVKQLEVSGDVEAQLIESRRALSDMRQNLQTTIEELESANEELQSTNEELVASNEELQSTNEELQSVNEELHTVNSEHQLKVHELTEQTKKLDDVLGALDLGVVLLDGQLCVERFNRAAGRYINILPRDVGRPFSHVTHSLGLPDLLDRLGEVMREGRAVAIETHGADSEAVIVKVQARLDSGQVRGVILTITDVTELFSTRTQHGLLTRALEISGVGIAVLSEDGELLESNRVFSDIVGRDLQHIVGRRIEEFAAESSKELVKEAVLQALGGVPWSGIARGVAPDGRLYWEVIELIANSDAATSGRLLRLSRDLAGVLPTTNLAGMLRAQYWVHDEDADKTFFTMGLPALLGSTPKELSERSVAELAESAGFSGLQELIATSLQSERGVVGRLVDKTSSPVFEAALQRRLTTNGTLLIGELHSLREPRNAE